MTDYSAIVSPSWLSAQLNDPDLRIVDVTTIRQPRTDGTIELLGRQAYDEEHIPGAVFAELFDGFNDSEPFIFTSPSQGKFAAAAGDLGLAPHHKIVVYEKGASKSGDYTPDVFAARFWWQLRYEGFQDVRVLAGGLRAWKESGQPVSTSPGSYPPVTVSTQRRRELIVARHEVEAAINDPASIIMDSLPQGIYRGDDSYPGSRPVARSGHIPGAWNVSHLNLVDTAAGGLPSPAKLAEIFAPSGASDASGKVITYCVGGIAAAWNALALYEAGNRDVAVYDGSLRDWLSVPDAALETGDPHEEAGGIFMTKLPKISRPWSAAEQEAREHLTAAGRILHEHGLTRLIHNHITLRVPDEDDAFLINPYGVFYDRLRASDLVKVKLDGTVPPGQRWEPNRSGWVIHGAIYQNRADVQAVLHTHAVHSTAVASLKEGLLPIVGEALLLHGRIGYHNFEGPSLHSDEQRRIAQDLGNNVALVMRNHGIAITGGSIGEALYLAFAFEDAARVQLAVQASGREAQVIPSAAIDSTLAALDGLPDWGQVLLDGILRRLDETDPSYRD